MKAIVAQARFVSAPLFALVSVASITALFSILMTPALVAALAALGILAFAFSDYSRKPSFRVRRNTTRATPPSHAAVITSLDWTYTSRAA
jgi:hypothetical protein